MTLAVPSLRSLAPIALLIAALPLTAAAPKRHAVGPVGDATIIGHVTDSTTGKPVKGVDVLNGTFKVTTDDLGAYLMKLPAGRQTQITASYFAFKPLTKTITPANGDTVDFALSPNPSIILKTTAGESVDLDYDTSKFAYTIVFSGIVKDDNANLCKPNGAHFLPNKSEFAKIVGPATIVTFSPCCTLGPVTTVNVEMKSGEKTAVYFNDSCSGYEPDFLGRERSTGNFRYFAFKDIAEITFP
jgi:hypothetical protein